MAAVARRTLLSLMQPRAREAGVDLRFSDRTGPTTCPAYDLVVAADGATLSRPRLVRAPSPA